MLVLTHASMRRPKALLYSVLVVCLALIGLVAVPTLAPHVAPMLHSLNIDTDPENMLAQEEPVRVFHRAQKAQFNLHDIVVVGVVDESTPNGAFTPETLQNVYALTEFAKTVTWQKEAVDGTTSSHGVIGVDIMAPSMVDNIEQAGLGAVSFAWLMPTPPKTQEEATAIAEKAKNLPLLDDTLVSGQGNALALYIPIAEKSDSYEVAQELREKIASFGGAAQYHITGLPIAQDQFGIEMFIQMAISAPAAMLLIFVLMWFFFRQVNMIISPMLVAMASVVFTMGLLVVTGNTVHVMSSMIPIFIMPIAVLDAVHILSDFFDRYQQVGNRKKTLEHVMAELSAPMFFTSLTTFAGFISLALTPIPPVQVFGVFVALGVAFAWLLTVTMVPAYIMLMPEKSFQNFGMKVHKNADGKTAGKEPLFNRVLHGLGRLTYSHYKLVLVAVLLVGGGASEGIQKIQINDNPVKWFAASHPIRVADKALNDRFGGTYMAYLSLSAPAEDDAKAIERLRADLIGKATRSLNPEVYQTLSEKAYGESYADVIANLQAYANEQLDTVEDDALWDAWDTASLYLSKAAQSGEIFKDPEILTYMADLQSYLLQTGKVGKVNGLVDVVRTVHRELLLGNEAEFRIPDTRNAVAQTLISFQNSHRPSDLWHFVTPDYRSSNLALQLTSGDNKDMKAVVDAVDAYIAEHPLPANLQANWFGLTYINVIWQDKMVKGMMESFLSSFVVVLLLMVFLFRSLWWGALAMVPLTFTIAAIYGLIGWVGKDYDMPVAVLSSLSLGLAVDYAIHFLARSRHAFQKYGSWALASQAVFGEPARAITRNVIVLGVGFLPLLAAPLVPYNTVGVFISAILLLAGVATLVILPALMRLVEPFLFKEKK